VDLYSASSRTHLALRYGTRSQRISQFYLHTPRSPGMNQLPFPSQPKLVLIYRPGKDGRLRLSWP